MLLKFNVILYNHCTRISIVILFDTLLIWSYVLSVM